MGLSRCGSPTTARCGWLLSLGGAATDRLLSRIAAGIDAAVDEVVAFWHRLVARHLCGCRR